MILARGIYTTRFDRQSSLAAAPSDSIPYAGSPSAGAVVAHAFRDAADRLTHASVMLLFALFSLGTAGCNRTDGPLDGTRGAESAPATGVLSISGSSTMQPLIKALALQFETRFPEIRIQVEAGGSSQGIGHVRTGHSQIGMISRNLEDNERDLQAFSIARDGVGLVVHRDNPVSNLRMTDVHAIFTGQVKSWQELGGPPAEIFTIMREPGRGLTNLINERITLGGVDLKADLTAGDNHEAFTALLSNRHAIAFISVGDSQRRAGAGLPVKVLDIDGIPASPYTIAYGHYPLVRPLTLVTRDLPEGLVKQFIDFCLSAQATAEVLRFDFTPYPD